MVETTLCYIERAGKVLLLHRTRKNEDPNHGKWIGVGGHIEPGETPEVCVLREVLEETGLKLLDCRARGVVRFRSDVNPDEDMYLFTATAFSGDLRECDEGELKCSSFRCGRAIACSFACSRRDAKNLIAR